MLSRAADVDELGDMTVRRNCGVKGSALAGVMLAGLVAAGCNHQPASPRRASVESCIQFGISAIKHHVTVTSVPAACQGLTRAQVNFAVGSALHAMAAAAHGKARQRERAAKLSPLLGHLVTTVPGQRSRPPVSAPAARQASRAPLGLAALFTWPITVLLLPVTGLGIALVIVSLPERTLAAAPISAAHTVSTGAGAAPVPLRDDPAPARHPPTLIVAAHGVFAVATILCALLATVGVG